MTVASYIHPGSERNATLYIKIKKHIENIFKNLSWKNSSIFPSYGWEITESLSYFDKSYYLDTYPDVRATGIDPFYHFAMHGWREKRNPNSWMSTSAYLDRYPELLTREENPLAHMVRVGSTASLRFEGRPAPLPPPSLLSMALEMQPDFPVKWRSGRYLALNLTELERARSQLQTFAVFDALFPETYLQTLVVGGAPLWRADTATGPVEIRLAVSRPVFNEGELSLNLTLSGQVIAILSFNILPGDLLDRTAADRLLVSRMQSYPGAQSMAKVATKALGDVIPQAALFAAAQGLAQVMNIDRFAGVPASRQVALHPSIVDRAAATYDRFWESVGAELGADGLYHGPVVGEPRPLSSIGPGHKIRTRRKRELKAAIREAARATLEAHKRR